MNGYISFSLTFMNSSQCIRGMSWASPYVSCFYCPAGFFSSDFGTCEPCAGGFYGVPNGLFETNKWFEPNFVAESLNF